MSAKLCRPQHAQERPPCDLVLTAGSKTAEVVEGALPFKPAALGRSTRFLRSEGG